MAISARTQAALRRLYGDEEYYDLGQVAEIFGWSRTTFGREFGLGRIASVQHGASSYIPQSAIDEYVRRSLRPAWIQPELPFEEALA